MNNKNNVLAYEDYVRGVDGLDPEQQLRLVEIISTSLKKHFGRKSGKHKITELDGLGSEIWNEVDVQEYIRKERSSWD